MRCILGEIAIRVCTRPYAGIFPGGGQDYLHYSRGKASEGAKCRSGGHEGAFAFLRLILNDLVHIQKSEENTYSWKMYASYTRITGNVKSKHKQNDHWHSQDVSTGDQSEEQSDRVAEGCPPSHGREICLNYVYPNSLFLAH